MIHTIVYSFSTTFLVYIHPFTECLLCAHPLHSNFPLYYSVDYNASNLESGEIHGGLNDEITIVAIQTLLLIVMVI